MTKFEKGDYEVEVLPADASVDEVEEGVVYYGKVNNVVNYGVFVTLSEGNGSGDVSGLIHSKRLMPTHRPQEFVVGDDVLVEKVGENEEGKPDLALVEAIGTVRDVRAPEGETRPHEVDLADVRDAAEATSDEQEDDTQERGDEVVDDIVDEADEETSESEPETEVEEVDDETSDEVDINDVLTTLRESPEVRDFVLDATEYGEVVEFDYDEEAERVTVTLDVDE
jgi:predicted RNA-binding protein with RPS1 domain